MRKNDRIRFARMKADELSGLFEHGLDGSAAWLSRTGHVLFLKLYEMNRENQRLTKSQTYPFIPFKHAASCIKVLDAAEAQGYVTFEKDTIDTRKLWVTPTRKLIDEVERDIDTAIERIVAFADELDPTWRRSQRKSRG